MTNLGRRPLLFRSWNDGKFRVLEGCVVRLCCLKSEMADCVAFACQVIHLTKGCEREVWWWLEPTCAGLHHTRIHTLAHQIVLVQPGAILGHHHRLGSPSGPHVHHLGSRVGIYQRPVQPQVIFAVRPPSLAASRGFFFLLRSGRKARREKQKEVFHSSRLVLFCLIWFCLIFSPPVLSHLFHVNSACLV